MAEQIGSLQAHKAQLIQSPPPEAAPAKPTETQAQPVKKKEQVSG